MYLEYFRSIYKKVKKQNTPTYKPTRSYWDVPLQSHFASVCLAISETDDRLASSERQSGQTRAREALGLKALCFSLPFVIFCFSFVAFFFYFCFYHKIFKIYI